MRWMPAAVMVIALGGSDPASHNVVSTGGVRIPADTAPPFLPPATIPELEARIREVLDSLKVPGAGLAIVRHDTVVYTGGLGLARVEPELPANAATLFRIGSTSKAFVALAALQLQREGKLSINDPIRKYLPQFWYQNDWEETDPIRIVHLLEHTSGFDDNSLMTYANNDPKPLTLTEGLALDSTTRVSRWRPGTRFAYCNTGPAIVARIIEVIEGKSFEQVVQERLFDRIGMHTATYFFPDTANLSAATLYRNDGRTPYPYWHVFIRPAGSINAAASDMAQYVRFLLNRGTVGDTVVVAGEDIDRMERSETWIGTRAGLTVGYGLHLYRASDTTGFVWTEHNGGVEGGLSDMSYIPDEGIGYAMQINSGNGTAFGEIRKLIRGYLTRDLPRPPEPQPVPVPVEVAAEFRGWYRPVSPRIQHLQFLERIIGLTSVRIVSDTLLSGTVMDAPEKLVAVDSLRFRRPGESVATLAFLRDPENGRPQAMEVNFGLPTSFTRVGSFQALLELGAAAAWVVAVLLGLVALALVPVRALVRRLRKRPPPSGNARWMWRTAMLASLATTAPLALMMLIGAGISDLGNLTPVSGSIYAGCLLYLAAAVFGLLLLLRSHGGVGFWKGVSLWTARGLMLMHAAGAAYFTWWGLIGWKPWN